MSGPVVLVGGGEFTAAMSAIDTRLLAATGRRRARVAILPTAAANAGEDALQRAIAAGLAHFGALGAEVEAVEVRDHSTADDPAHAQAIGEADVIYLCDGDPGRLRSALAGSLVWAAVQSAHARGAVLVGCGGGASVLGARAVDVGLRLGWPLRWPAGLGAADGVAVLPSYDATPEPLLALLALGAPRGLAVFGIDRETVVIGRDGAWEVDGRARVTVWQGRTHSRHRRGDAFRLDLDGRSSAD
jgi:cyanophycinase-like exopeptidase